MDDEDGDSKMRKRGFCQTWCDMWFLLSQTSESSISQSAFLLEILLIAPKSQLELPKLPSLL